MLIAALDWYGRDFGVSRIDWSLDRPSGVNVSGWTGRRTVVTNPWHGKWRAHVELLPVVGKDNSRALRSFFARARGSLGFFSIPATESAQNEDEGVVVGVAAPAGATSLQITGFTAPLLDGQFFTINGQLCCLTDDQDDDLLTFEPPLREAAAGGVTVVTNRPYAMVFLSSSVATWTLAGPAVYGAAFDVEEAILEHSDGSAATVDSVEMTWDSMTGEWDIA